MNLEVMLEKINTIADSRIKAEEDKDNLEKELITKYADTIDDMSERISNMLDIVNLLAERKIPNTEYTRQLYHDFCRELKIKDIKIQFLSSELKYSESPYLQYLEPPYTYVCSIVVEKEGALSPNTYWTRVDKYGSPRCTQKWQSGSESNVEVSSKLLLNFINEFEKAEQALQEYVEGLE